MSWYLDDEVRVVDFGVAACFRLHRFLVQIQILVLIIIRGCDEFWDNLLFLLQKWLGRIHL